MTDAPASNATGRDRRTLIPEPSRVRYNDWRQVDMPAPETFMPTRTVSVIISSYQTPAETLAMTVAALEGQTYPREMFELVIVDDGSQPPVELPQSTPLDVKVVRQERRGFGLARARNTGARAAAHDILLFLDSDMLTEAGWMAAHARWHHVVSDAVTVGLRSHVAADLLDAETIRHRPGSLRDLFSDRPEQPVELFKFEARMLRRTHDLTRRADDVFGMVVGGNCGIGKDFYHLVGGMDESFGRYSGEDTEFGYRAYTRGGLLVPVRDAFAWHLGLYEENRDPKERSARLQRGKLANLIAHQAFRDNRPGRMFAVPQYVVTIKAKHLPANLIKRTTAQILADRVHDLVVRIETYASDESEQLVQLREEFGPDARVRIGPTRSALDEFPSAPFHVSLPGGVVFAKDLVHRLRARLGDAVTAAAVLSDGSLVSIIRAWALHRARRTAADPADFGEARTLSATKLKLMVAAPSPAAVDYPTSWDRLRYRLRDLRSAGEAWLFLKWLASAAWGRTVTQLLMVSWYVRRWMRRTWFHRS